jgi:hypothetical protein
VSACEGHERPDIQPGSDAWNRLSDEVSAFIDYFEAGGQRSFESWRDQPCCECSSRHDDNPESIRPTGEKTQRRCLELLAERAGRGRSAPQVSA